MKSLAVLKTRISVVSPSAASFFRKLQDGARWAFDVHEIVENWDRRMAESQRTVQEKNTWPLSLPTHLERPANSSGE